MKTLFREKFFFCPIPCRWRFFSYLEERVKDWVGLEISTLVAGADFGAYDPEIQVSQDAAWGSRTGVRRGGPVVY